MATDYRGLVHGQQWFPDEVVDETVTNVQYPGGNPVYPRQVYQDRIMNPDLMRIAQERGNIENKGFNFPSIWGGVKGGLEWLGEKFKRPEQKQIAYDAIMGSRDDQGWGTYKGNKYNIQDGKIYSEVNPFGKNFDSAFGSQSVEEMDNKTLNWAMDRLSKGKAISTRLRNILSNRGMLDVTGTDRIGGDITSKTFHPSDGGTTTGGSTYTGPPTTDFNVAQFAKAGRRPDTPGGFTNPGAGSYGPWKAQGGRVGLYAGGDPEEPAEDITAFMQDQGIPGGEMVEEQITEEQKAMVLDMLDKEIDVETIISVTGVGRDDIVRIMSESETSMAPDFEGQGEGIASLV